MSFLRRVVNGSELLGYSFWCPGCKFRHWFPIPRWAFNGNLECPSFTPSLKNTWTHGMDGTPMCCHLILTEGVLHYCTDCTHDLAGQKVKLQEEPE